VLPVWLYWEGALPEWIRVCQETVRRHAPDVRLVTPAEWDRLWDRDRDLDLDRLCVAHRADYIRAFLLARHGGLWIDSDCVVTRPLAPLLERLGECEFTGYHERAGHVSNNFMGAPPGSGLMEAFYRRVCAVLRTGRPLSWLEIGSHALTPVLREAGRPWRRLGYELIQPICWSRPGEFFRQGTPEEHAGRLNQRSLCYMLSHNMVQGFERDHPGRSLLEADTFFSYLVAVSRGEHPPAVPPRRTSVGTSNWQQIPFCVEAMLAIAPMRVLDVGIGFGRWGMLVREFCEEWKGRIHRENWRVRLEGIEAFHANVEEYHHHFYNWVHVGDAAEVLPRLGGGWNLTIFGDVLEHWEKPQAERTLSHALAQSDYVLVNVPLGAHWERGGMYGNPYEAHRSRWDLEELLALDPVRHVTFRECFGRDYGAFVLSREDPAGLRGSGG
jgi:hypothetical protein